MQPLFGAAGVQVPQHMASLSALPGIGHLAGVLPQSNFPAFNNGIASRPQDQTDGKQAYSKASMARPPVTEETKPQQNQKEPEVDLAAALSNHLSNPTSAPSIELIQALARAAQLPDANSARTACLNASQAPSTVPAPSDAKSSGAAKAAPETSPADPSQIPVNGKEETQALVRQSSQGAETESDKKQESQECVALPTSARATAGPASSIYEYQIAPNDLLDMSIRNVRRRIEVEVGDGCTVELTMETVR